MGFFGVPYVTDPKWVTWGNLREMVCRWQKGKSFEISLEPWGQRFPRATELAGYPLKFRAFWPPHGLVVFYFEGETFEYPVANKFNWFHMTFTVLSLLQGRLSHH